MNDTTGTQLAVGLNDPNCHVGLILGTGTNACYMESLDAVPKYTGDRTKYSKVIINCEWGAFGDDGKLDPYLTDFDHELDKLVFNKGQQLYVSLLVLIILNAMIIPVYIEEPSRPSEIRTTVVQTKNVLSGVN